MISIPIKTPTATKREASFGWQAEIASGKSSPAATESIAPAASESTTERAKGAIEPIEKPMRAPPTVASPVRAVIIIADGFFAPPEIRGAEIAIPSGML